MKKLLALLLVLVLVVSLAACGNQKLTMRQLIEANHSDTLLETYDSISVDVTMNGEPYTGYYLTETYAYEKADGWSMYLTEDTGFACIDGVYERVVFITRDGLADYTDYRAAEYSDLVLSEESLMEKIQSVTETDEQITVTTTMGKKNLAKAVGVAGLQSFECSYVVDADTYSLIDLSGFITYNEEETVNFTAKSSYNTEMPEEIKPFMEYENQTEDLRTVTFVFHSGTEKEKSETILTPKGISVGLRMPVGYTEGISVYADAACTVAYESNGDFTSDVTVYIK